MRYSISNVRTSEIPQHSDFPKLDFYGRKVTQKRSQLERFLKHLAGCDEFHSGDPMRRGDRRSIFDGPCRNQVSIGEVRPPSPSRTMEKTVHAILLHPASIGRYNAAITVKNANILRLPPQFLRSMPLMSGLSAGHDHAPGMS
jgi:hypothetical protein